MKNISINITAGSDFMQQEDNINNKSIERDMDSFTEGLKKTLLGKNNQFFLVNDKNQEIRQHYDKKYHHNLDIEEFKNSIRSKKEYLSRKNIKYGFYAVPDKSITLRQYLPFETENPYRNVDKLKGYVTDLKPIITQSDTLSNDTHITKKSSLKIIPYILSNLHEESAQYYTEELEKRLYLKDEKHEGDLFGYKNWSYPRDKFFQENRVIETESVELKGSYEEVEENLIPAQFRHVSIRQSRYYKNSNSLLDKRAVVIHDSTTEQLVNTFIATYREVFFYWDHWYFNRKLIEWFKPDDVIEIRTERFLENPLYPIVDDDYTVKYPVNVCLEDFSVDTDSLKFKLTVKDYCRMPVESEVKVFVDDVLIMEDFNKSSFNIKHCLTGYPSGEHMLKILVTDKYGEVHEICRTFPLYEKLDTLFNGLKNTLKGKNNVFFRIHDRNNEMLQHYDRMYIPRLDTDKFNETTEYKKTFTGGRNILYKVFCIPDKSVMLKDYLPFDAVSPKRLISYLDDVNDLKDLLTEDDYLLNDTNLSDKVCIRLVAYMLSTISSEVSMDEYENEILERVEMVTFMHRGNLLTNNAWSYDDELRKKFYSISTGKVSLKNSYKEVDIEEIPFESREFGKIKSKYYKNDNAILDMKAIIIHDSSINPFIQPLIASFSEVFFYYDQWYFNKHLLDWFDAQVILEIREESSFENPVYPIVSEIDEVRIPTNVYFKRFDVDDNTLHVDLEVYDLKNLPVNTTCKFLIDEQHVSNGSVRDACMSFTYNTEDLPEGKHTLNIIFEATETTKAKNLKKDFKT